MFNLQCAMLHCETSDKSNCFFAWSLVFYFSFTLRAASHEKFRKALDVLAFYSQFQHFVVNKTT